MIYAELYVTVINLEVGVNVKVTFFVDKIVFIA